MSGPKRVIRPSFSPESVIRLVISFTETLLVDDGQTESYEPDAAHVTHLIQSDSKERKVKSADYTLLAGRVGL